MPKENAIMAIQTAPDQILFTISSADDSALDLMEVSDGQIGYVVENFGGTNFSNPAVAPKVTISRRPATKQSRADKYTVKAVYPTYDVLGVMTAQELINVDLVVPTAFTGDTLHLLKGVISVLSSETFQTALSTRTFWR